MYCLSLSILYFRLSEAICNSFLSSLLSMVVSCGLSCSLASSSPPAGVGDVVTLAFTILGSCLDLESWREKLDLNSL